MSWIRIEDKFCSHPKLMQGGALAICLQIRALCYAGQHLTDGHIPSGALTVMTADFCELDLLGHPDHPEGATNAGGIDWGARMVTLGLWDAHDEGWMIHDYLDYNPSRKDQESLQRLRQREGRKAALKRWGQERELRVQRMPLPQPPIQDWLTTLKANPAYQHLSIDTELAKMDAWLSTKPGRKKTKSFVVNWLNKIEAPVQSNGSGTRPPPPPPKNDPIGRGQWGKTYGRPEDHGYQ